MSKKQDLENRIKHLKSEIEYLEDENNSLKQTIEHLRTELNKSTTVTSFPEIAIEDKYRVCHGTKFITLADASELQYQNCQIFYCESDPNGNKEAIDEALSDGSMIWVTNLVDWLIWDDVKYRVASVRYHDDLDKFLIVQKETDLWVLV